MKERKTHIKGKCKQVWDLIFVSKNPTCKSCLGISNFDRSYMAKHFEKNKKKKELSRIKQDLYARWVIDSF